jgi:hypothetical protein
MIVIAFGNKARQGKDYIARFMKEAVEATEGEVFVVHWADALYDECRNCQREKPLIEKKIKQGKEVYFLLTSDIPEGYFAEEVPLIKNFMDVRDLAIYWGMDVKDSWLLQAWGTGLRRRYFGEDYWVKKTLLNIDHLKKISNEALILIPDTRFRAEYIVVKNELKGFYIKVLRWNSDGSRFLDQERDINHQSEIELDDILPDYTIEALSGDLAGLKDQSIAVLKNILEKAGRLL